jgi:hypothetical protein
MRQRWRRWVLGAAAAALVLVVGGPFVYIHFVEGKAPAPLSLSSEPTTTTVGATTAANGTTGTSVSTSGTVSVDGVWKVSSGSQAGYRIKE